MPKHLIKPKHRLKTTKAMFEYLGFDSDAVLSSWLMLCKCNGSLVQDLSIEDKNSLFRKMFKEDGFDLDKCISDWTDHYREKPDSRQIKALVKINPGLSPEEIKEKLKVYRSVL